MEVHETAFVTCAFRAMHKDLSRDAYASLWHNDRVQEWANTYLNRVTPEESVAHSLRNRYYLDLLEKLAREEKIRYLINFGAGFSMYPYLLPETLRHIEIDLPVPVSYKKKKVKQWQEEGKLPLRDVHYLACNFSENYEKELYHTIMNIKQDAPCFILLEGVLFFLKKEDTDTLFHLFNKLQNEGELTGSVSFRKEDTENKAFKLLLEFMKEEQPQPGTAVFYQTVEDGYYENLGYYEISDHQDFFSLAERYEHHPTQNSDLIINEQFYVLKKVGG